MSKVNHELQAALAHVAPSRPANNALPATPQTVGRVGIVGANTLGIGVALRLLEADIPVTVFELDRASLGEGIAMARSAFQDAGQDGEPATARERRMALLAGTINFHHLKECDLVIEAVSTDFKSKGKLFRRLDETVKPGAILVTGTSPSRVDQLAACTRRAGEVMGLQVSRPAHAGETWTLVPGKASAGQALATVVALVQHLGKACAVSSELGSGAGHENGNEDIEHHATAWQVERIVE